MDIKMYELPQLNGIGSLLRNSELKFSTSYKVAKIFECVDKELAIYRDRLQQIIDNYAEKDEKGNYVTNSDGIKIAEANLTVCRNELNDLNMITVQLPDYHFTMDEFDSVNCSPAEIEPMLKFINE